MNPALIYCEADDARLCELCDARIHSVDHIAQRHVRMPINEMPGAPIGHCIDHPDTLCDEFCTVCRLPLCENCRTLGSHGMGEAAKHRRVKLMDAYQHELKTGGRRTDTEAPALPSRVWVEGQIAEMDEQLATAQKNGKATEDKAYDTVQQAIRQCQDLAEDQIASLVGDELELKRQLDQAEWLESFLEEPVKELPQADFLAAWLQHCRVREELEEFGSFTPARVYTGLRLGGALRVSTAPAVLGSAKSSAQDARAAWKLRA
eukprot:gnl/TRDRNA2_/TRDRNA2_131337_c0_seq1.p1 gnl/TRDRNA2_/TRDRNA2_131337_c0~~gnl/TRDRNA2_/TRDRNA2_131337_c0_seq1.p1  ORF type:complete len:262 (-),score=49.06 gnl/TRDRNA2_/TRDRNA2_131337_c0_seq1:4-789(-)